MSPPSYLKKLLLDCVLIIVAYWLALLIDDNFSVTSLRYDRFFNSFPYVFGIQLTVFVLSNLYSSIWLYASLKDVLDIFRAVSLAVAVTAFGLLFVRDSLVSYRSLLVIDWGLLMAFMLGSRFAWRFYQENKTHILPQGGEGFVGRRTLIVGAGDAGNLLLKEIQKQHDSGYTVVGFIDDDISKKNLTIGGIPVLGSISQLPGLLISHMIEEVIIAIPSAPYKVVRKVVACCKKTGVRFKTLPGISELINGTVSVSQIRDVDIEDLLGRDEVRLDQLAIQNYLTGKRVLVTGAAGSIGSEICRQICSYEPSKLILLDNAETPLYQIEKELVERHPELRIVPVLADVRQKERIETLFDSFLPQVVFHAAAYKHVPMMEYNPVEAITNNVGGTANLVDACSGCGVENFVMISTDKAVNPTNVMGASKRAAELYVQASARQSRTCFTTVRFGNVLGSNGSVIPLFKEQIRKGGPVTVTDARVIRYFMTIPEACQLVLQAGCLGCGGNIFLLDMGEPVRILDLAEELIRLSGFVPYEDIEIVFTGLRPGEKLYEELLIDGENILRTSHEKIRVLAPVQLDAREIKAGIMGLLAEAASADTGLILKGLKKIVPEFTPRYHFEGDPPFVFKRLRPDVCDSN